MSDDRDARFKISEKFRTEAVLVTERMGARIAELEAALQRMLAVYEALMPGVKHIAVQNYAELNDAPLEARRLLRDRRRSLDEWRAAVVKPGDCGRPTYVFFYGGGGIPVTMCLEHFRRCTWPESADGVERIVFASDDDAASWCAEPAL